ncbi:putative membrane protein YdbT with pleckstrin-like domain [Natronospira proteinivora]|uniref:Membrane protein YdbT with pleckstrin-like domain n=1 Tax=Natronospira proteinivora TaxID=1807133 RepID=A0ABT1GBW6_9GAMM|nr:PH domain-containing protein [Natronospira proteinivora]MCP1728562.1 putative membrane protein YdbT with pleckstrin-like domain [Natronospira proteinivora]
MPKINVQLRPAWRNYWAGFVIAALLLLAALGGTVAEAEGEAEIGGGIFLALALVVLGFVAFKRYSWKFSIDGNRVSRHYGIISRNQQSVRIKDLRSVELDQSLFQRLFGIGNLSFYSAGSATAEVKFHGIKEPAEWRDKIDNAMDQLKDSNE